jgi:hypothetical protein
MVRNYALNKQEICARLEAVASRPLWDPPSLLPTGYCGLFLGVYDGRHVKLIIHLHLVPRLKLHGVTSPFPPCVFITYRKNLASVTGFITDASVNSRNTAARNGNGEGQIRLRRQFLNLLSQKHYNTILQTSPKLFVQC